MPQSTQTVQDLQVLVQNLQFTIQQLQDQSPILQANPTVQVLQVMVQQLQVKIHQLQEQQFQEQQVREQQTDELKEEVQYWIVECEHYQQLLEQLQFDVVSSDPEDPPESP